MGRDHWTREQEQEDSVGIPLRFAVMLAPRMAGPHDKQQARDQVAPPRPPHAVVCKHLLPPSRRPIVITITCVIRHVTRD